MLAALVGDIFRPRCTVLLPEALFFVPVPLLATVVVEPGCAPVVMAVSTGAKAAGTCASGAPVLVDAGS